MHSEHQTLEPAVDRPIGNQFAEDVLRGLSRKPKALSSKYFYDARGSRLFQQITRQPEYYLTRCELEVLNRHRGQLAELLEGESFRLVELGVGDGHKTEVLLGELLDRALEFEFVPVDICRESLMQLTARLEQQLAGLPLSIRALRAEYWDALEELNGETQSRNVVMFLGSNIGNFTPVEAEDFLCQLHKSLRPGDLALIGFDLKKDLHSMIRAYNDAAGVTRQFNLNLLSRINRELDADFLPGRFAHHGFYNPAAGRMESWLLATEAHAVKIGKLDRVFQFDAWEGIHVENSQKFTLGEIDYLAKTCGFVVERHFLDSRRWFADSLWRVA